MTKTIKLFCNQWGKLLNAATGDPFFCYSIFQHLSRRREGNFILTISTEKKAGFKPFKVRDYGAGDIRYWDEKEQIFRVSYTSASIFVGPILKYREISALYLRLQYNGN